MFKIIRIFALLIILMSVWTTLSLQKKVSDDWNKALDIRIIPVLADSSPKTKKFVNQLELKHFANIERYLIAQGKHYEQDLHSVLNITIDDAINNPPPVTPGGLQNGLIGLIQARADARYRNLHATTIVHELLHIFGASDKYDIASGRPMFPHGYANTKNGNRYPQSRAEIMARAIPLTNDQFEVATRLGQTVVGLTTAREIGWASDRTKINQ